MNIIQILIIILFVVSFVEFLFPRQKKLNQQVYLLSFAATFFIVSIKYYYGSDIVGYYSLYTSVASPWEIITNITANDSVKMGASVGYVFLCSVLKYCGISFWGISFIVTIIYFSAIYRLFALVDQYKVFGLFLIALLDHNLLFLAFKQMLAVSFFIFCFLAFLNHKAKRGIAFAFIAITMHGSAIFALLLLFVGMYWNRIRVSKAWWYCLLIALCLLFVVSLEPLVPFIMQMVPSGTSIADKLHYHLLAPKPRQTIFAIYVCFIFCIIKYVNHEKVKKWNFLAFLFCAAIVAFYQYWLLLIRFHAYLVPLLFIYGVYLMGENKVQIYKQILVVVVYLYAINFIIKSYRYNINSESKVTSTTTIFNRITESEESIRERNFKKAKLYWEKEIHEK
jgi:hypothetical protein